MTFKGLLKFIFKFSNIYASNTSSRSPLTRQLSSTLIWTTVVVSAVQSGDWSLEIVIKFRPGRVDASCRVRSDKLNDLQSLPTVCKCKLWSDVERFVLFWSRSVVLPSIMLLRILMLFAIIELFWWVMAVINLQFGWWPLWDVEARRSR